MGLGNDKHHVLVLDDDKIDLQAICRVLYERDDLDVADMACGMEALQTISSTEKLPKVIVTDLFMPQIDAIEFMRQLRQMNANIPIIVISGQGQRGNLDFLRMASRLGAARVIEKRNMDAQLGDAINDVLDAPTSPPDLPASA